jgi:hypothetical protein
MNYRRVVLRFCFLSIILNLYSINHVFAQNPVKITGFETGLFSPHRVALPANENSSVTIDTNHVYAGEFCAIISNRERNFYQPVNLEPNSVSALRGSRAGNVWVDDLKLTAETTEQIADEPGGAGVYYVSPTGNDNNTGTSPQDAWQTIEKVNRVDFEPGDSIFFEGSQTFNGNIRFNHNDSGSAGSNVHLSSFGTGRATIDAGTGTGFTASDCSFLSIINLNFKGDGRKTGNTGNGITFSFCSDILVDSVEVSGFQHSGVTARNTGQHYSFTHIHAHNNGFAGIFIAGIDKNSLSDIYIGHCIADNNPGDPTVLDNHSGNGILAYQSKNIIIEYCKASNNGWDMPRTGNGPGGIWVAEVDSAIIQYCISHDNKTSVGGQDGLGFDLDGGITNSVIQYCLSYNNQGAGFGIFQYNGATEWKNNTIRYCISENDGNVSAGSNILIWNGSGNKGEFQGLEFYNNVIYNSSRAVLAFYDHYNSNFNFRNNIFISKTSNVYNRINGENFQGNCWYTINNNFYLDSLNFMAWAQTAKQEMLNGEIVGIYANPNLIYPGNSNITDPTLLQTVDDYKVQEYSSVTDAGLDLDSLFNINPGNQDYFGNSIKQGPAFDMGVYEFIAPSHDPDNTKPVVTSFLVPETSSSLNIPVIEFSATDNIAVNGYKLTETSTTPMPVDAGWSAFAPESYTFATEGTKTIYAWTKDAAGNVSVSLSDQVEITLPRTLGNIEVYSSVSTGLSRKAMPVYFTESGTITSISIYHNGGSGNALLGVYADQSGLPTSQLGATPSTVVNSNAGWQKVTLTSPVTVTSGQTVWLAWVFQNTIGTRYTSGTPGRALSAQQWTGGMPATYGTSSTAGTKYSIYCTYIPGEPETPATVDLGNTEVYGSISTGLSRKAMPVKFNESGSITSISIYHDGGAGNVLLGVYADLSGLPSSQLGVTPSTVVKSTAGWQTVTLSKPVTVTAGQTVWLAWVFQNGISIRYTTGTPGRAISTATWSAGMPATFGSSSTSGTKYSIYCTYVPGEQEPPATGNLGNTSVYSTISTGLSRKAMPVKFNESGSITSISIYHDGGAGNVLLGVYADLSGLPSSQLGVTPSTVVKSTAGWQTVTLSKPVTVTAGQTVWLAWVFQNGISIRYTTGTPGRAISTATWSAGMPATFGSSSTSGTKYSIYCTYVPGEQEPPATGNLGNTSVYSTISTGLSRKAMPVKFNESGSITSISIYHDGGAGNVLLGVYADLSGLPSSQMGVTPSTVVNSKAGWQTVTLSKPVTVTAGQTVWLAWVFQNGISIRYTTGTPGRAISTATWTAGMPATFGSSSTAGTKYSIYCTYTVNATILKDAIIPNAVEVEPVQTLSVDNNNQVLKEISVENSIYPQEVNDFKLYPNPANTFVNVDYSDMPEVETKIISIIIIIDGSGRTILNQLVESTSNRIDINQFPSGLYFLKLINQHWTNTKKLIIKK